MAERYDGICKSCGQRFHYTEIGTDDPGATITSATISCPYCWQPVSYEKTTGRFVSRKWQKGEQDPRD